jgi:NADP-dependent 3-hydroxy acid dehydrogenase YdfG
MARGVILGATAGVGTAVAKHRMAAGDEVVGVGRRAADVAAHVLPNGCVYRRADIRDHDALRRVLVDDELGLPDYIVNCTGVGFYAPLDGDYTAAWQEVLDTDVRGALNLASIVVEHLDALRQLVHISSLAAHRPSRTPGNLAYSVAKTGARMVVAELRRELRDLGRRTRTSMVSPGLVEGTDFDRNFYKYAEPNGGPIPLYDAFQNLVPDDVADVVDFVLDRSDHVEVLDVLVAPRDQP